MVSAGPSSACTMTACASPRLLTPDSVQRATTRASSPVHAPASFAAVLPRATHASRATRRCLCSAAPVSGGSLRRAPSRRATH